MIKIEKTEVFGWEAAIRGMRNPMNSWEKSDSMWCYDVANCEDCENCDLELCTDDKYIIGENDLELMTKLVKGGTDHSKFMRMINVTCDVTAPLYWWKEFDTYKVGTVANSCSTMHKIHEKQFEMDDFSHENMTASGIYMLDKVIGELNVSRFEYRRTKDKKYWWDMIQLLPSSYNQKRTVQLNYQVLRNMFHARKEHKQDEWRVEFCEWIKTLPYSELITM